VAGHHRIAGAALLAALAVPAPAGATPATVSLRVEGAHSTLFEGPVRTDGRAVDGHDGTGAHACQGSEPSVPQPTPTTALADAGLPWRGTWTPDFNDFFVDAIGPDASAPPATYWSILADGFLTAGGCTETLAPGEQVLFAYGSAGSVLDLMGPQRVEPGRSFTVLVREWRADESGARYRAVPGAQVAGATTDAQGEAAVRFDDAGWQALKATRAGSVRSNALLVCVAPCDAAPPAPPAAVLPPPGPLPPAPAVTPGLRVTAPHRFDPRRGLRVVATVEVPARLTVELWRARGGVRLARRTLGYASGRRVARIRPRAGRLPHRRRFALALRVTARTREGVTERVRLRVTARTREGVTERVRRRVTARTREGVTERVRRRIAVRAPG
jgi:hypothetical protein